MQNESNKPPAATSADLHGPGSGPGCGASAPRPALPRLKKHNCTKTGSQRARYVAEENIRLYIQNFGENNVGVLTVTTPSECLSAVAYQKKWRSFLTHVLKKLFPTGMWTRERQSRTGNWHSHSVVNMGWDIKTGFPFDEVKRRIYRNVDSRLRKIWKILRESGKEYGFGRIELLPIKRSGAGCARYLVKYLAKSRDSDKSEGEEKCRLFGIWGGVRFVRTPFSFVSSRIIRKRMEWCASEVFIDSYEDFKRVFGPHWWFYIWPSLREVILPEEFYKVPVGAELVWDDLGFRAYCEDVARFSHSPSVEDAQKHSWFRFFWEVGKWLYRGEEGQVRDYVHGKIARMPVVETPLDPQLLLDLRRPDAGRK